MSRRPRRNHSAAFKAKVALAAVRIRALTTAPRIKPTSIFLRSARRLNPGRGSTYRRGDSVQTTGTSSSITEPNHVWASDITYIPMALGFLYLVAIIDWASRAVLAWRLSNTMDTGFCIAALDEALARHGTPKIFNTDQGAQFTSVAFTGRLEAAGIAISMDGRGRFMDNIFIERLWRSIKYEEVHLKAYADGREARDGIGSWMNFYN